MVSHNTSIRLGIKRRPLFSRRSQSQGNGSNLLSSTRSNALVVGPCKSLSRLRKESIFSGCGGRIQNRGRVSITNAAATSDLPLLPESSEAFLETRLDFLLPLRGAPLQTHLPRYPRRRAPRPRSSRLHRPAEKPGAGRAAGMEEPCLGGLRPNAEPVGGTNTKPKLHGTKADPESSAGSAERFPFVRATGQRPSLGAAIGVLWPRGWK